METKKNPSVDLTKKSGYFFSIGLLIAMSIVVTAFEWRQEESFVVLSGKIQDDFPEWIEVQPTQIDPPIPTPLKNVIVKEVPDEADVTDVPIIDAELTEISEPIEVISQSEAPELTDELPFDIVEVSASPKNGFQMFYKEIGDRIKYPAQARRMGVEGRVFVEFIINKDGSLSEVKAIKGIGAGCDEEAVRIIQSAPAWNPGKQRGKAVRQRYTLPIIFKLG
jgi:periplasmic protein TonB